MKKLKLIIKFLIIIFFGIINYTPAHSFSSYGKYTGQGEVKITKQIFDLLEFYFSEGRYGEIYNNPKYDWEKELIKLRWKGMFFIISKNGKGIYWYYNPYGDNADTKPNLLGNARIECKKQGHGECFVFAVKNKIVWQNGINPKKGTRIKRKEARNGMLSTKLKELGFYDDGITKTKKIEKKKEKKTEEVKTTSSSLSKELKELKKLYEDGVLTKEEFEKAKKKLLD